MRYRDRYLRRARAKSVDEVLARQAQIIADRAALATYIREAPERSYICVLLFTPEDRSEPLRYRSIDDQGATSSYKDNFVAGVFYRMTLDASLSFVNYVEVEEPAEGSDADA
jgi:hypothetical protein